MGEGVLSKIKPEIVWNIFEEITKVPRPSGKEEKIRSWVKSWANKHGIPAHEDNAGNIHLIADVSPGFANYPTLVLQAHMDMVCHKRSDLEFDFEKDSIRVKIEGEYVKAEGTTLGSDNGIGMALALATLIAEDLKHGPIEVALTVGEEVGFVGAFQMKPGFFKGKYLINLDSESLGEITISSAGGGDTIFKFNVKLQKHRGWKGLSISVDNLKSGHSGVEIHLNRLNAIKVVYGGIAELKKGMNVLLGGFEGGAAMNVIPASAKATVLVPESEINTAINILESWKAKNIESTRENEPEMKINISKAEISNAYPAEISSKILELIETIPHGPLSFSKDIDGLVQTSNNLAMIKSTPKSFIVSVNSRSSVHSEMEELRSRLRSLGIKHGASVELKPEYPGWVSNPKSPLVQLLKRTYEGVLGKEVSLRAVHAGLECGLFSKLNPEIQIASIGPDIQNAHSPEERVRIESVSKVWEVIRRIIENMNSLS
ncbi:MAG: beta-Ala-His dipeptidase [Spirochaetota bacterium]